MCHLLRVTYLFYVVDYEVAVRSTETLCPLAQDSLRFGMILNHPCLLAIGRCNSGRRYSEGIILLSLLALGLSMR